jgi:putative transposase
MMVEAVRSGRSQRNVAHTCRVALCTVQRWLERAGDDALDRVDWTSRSHAPHRVPRRASSEVETAVLACRKQLKDESPLGFYSADAIQEALRATGRFGTVPSTRTIGRILARNGALDSRRRIRRTAPPPGWYLADVARGRAELDSYDVIEGLVIEDHGEVEVLTGRALWGHQALAWTRPHLIAKSLVRRLLVHWRREGLPDYAQFDNDTRFTGPHQYRDVVGRVARVCLSLGITPVYAPPRETGFQAAIESFNNVWQQKVWGRYHHDNWAALQDRSAQFITAYTRRLAGRGERAVQRRPFPDGWKMDLQKELTGRLIYLRRTDERGIVQLLGREFQIGHPWTHRLVRCEFHISAGELRCYRLRRREPEQQPLIQVIKHQLPERRFDE